MKLIGLMIQIYMCNQKHGFVQYSWVSSVNQIKNAPWLLVWFSNIATGISDRVLVKKKKPKNTSPK